MSDAELYTGVDVTQALDKIRFGHGKHIGNVREFNEDSYACDPELGLWVVADGMGGHECGDIASQIAVDFIIEQVRQGHELQDAIGQAHKIIHLAAEQNLGMPGMGTTVVAIRLQENRFEVGWVGDSRAYLISKGSLYQITRDHSFVQQMIDAGELSHLEARSHPYRNVITQALGASDIQEVSVGYVDGIFYRDHQILLCSDGLTSEVGEIEIREALIGDLTEQQKVDVLIQSALDNGGADNVTVVLVSAPDDAPAKPEEEPTIPMDIETVRKVIGH